MPPNSIHQPPLEVDVARLRPAMRTRARLLRACAGCGRRCTTSPCARCAPNGAATYSDPEYQRNRAITLAEEHICWLCGEPGTEDDPLTADHIVSLSAGGTNARSNLHAGHGSCNSERQATPTGGHQRRAETDGAHSAPLREGKFQHEKSVAL